MGKNHLPFNEEELLNALAKNKEPALEQIFNLYHKQLFHFIYKYIGNREAAEEISQDVFINLWKKREALNIHVSLKAYLYAMAKNSSIDYIRKYFQEKYKTSELELVHSTYNNTEEEYRSKELGSIIEKGIESLPEKCKIIFRLSRLKQLSYKEIAETLNISAKTVETQMGIALKRLKEYVGRHWLSACILLFFS